MKQLLPALALLAFCNTARAQTTITAADMPVAGDTLRYSIAVDTGSLLDITTTGPGTAWDYSGLTRLIQGRDDYKSATQVNILYAITISASAYGYKIADSLPGTPVPVTDLYTFFSKKSSPSRYVAEAFAAKVTGLPTAINYSNEDEWYFFPLAYNDVDSSDFKLSYTMSGFGSFSQQGTRKTYVDGWGTIKTPYYSTPADCIRVKSEIDEIDSVSFSGQSIGIPRNSIEYKWLVNGEHYPALWIVLNVVAGQEIPATARYRDVYHPPTLGISQPSSPVAALNAYPNPASGGLMTLDIPAAWKQYSVELFDMQGKLAMACVNTPALDVAALPSGQYLVRVMSGNETGFVKITK